MKSEPRRSVVVTQVGDNYRLERATNFLEIRVGKILSRKEVEGLISDKISVTVQRNR